MYGRQLRGLGSVPMTQYRRDSWAGGDATVDQANLDDDTVGNGIFDGVGAPPVQHGGDGIFEAKYSEPGYLYRERMTHPGAIVDVNTGLPMVFRPGGGGWPQDMEDSYQPYDNEVARYHGRPESTSPEDSFGVRPAAAPAQSSATPLVDTAKPVSGLGETESASASTAQWAVAGLILGVAAAIFVGTLKAKG